jgi:phage-related holin
MVKPFTQRRGTTQPPSSRSEYRIGIVDLTNYLWNPDDDQYKVICRMVHVTKAALHIGYVQMLISFVFSAFFGYHYMLAVTGNLSSEHWVNQYTARYISQLLFAVSVQLILVVVMLHGIRSERRSLLLPYIGYAAVAILAGCVQLGSDFLSIDRTQSPEHKAYNSSQFIGHLIGTLIHAWCLSVVWRCYTYFGEKKVARQISEQLSATQAAFHYPDQMLSCIMSQPPPYYAEATIAVPKQQEPSEEKQPLNVV